MPLKSKVNAMVKHSSKYSGPFIKEGLCVDVQIFYELKEGWKLSTYDGENKPVIWSETFQTELDAWNHFLEIVARDGMEALSGPTSIMHRWKNFV
jgi:hypothetical protein